MLELQKQSLFGNLLPLPPPSPVFPPANYCKTWFCLSLRFRFVSTFFSYAGYSKKGFAPYNPRKRNQDALVMAEDPSTASLFLAVMDGHGEVGDKVAQVGVFFSPLRLCLV